MASYYLSFKCDTCGEIAVAAIGLSPDRQQELFSADSMYEAQCQQGHQSTYFIAQLVEIHRKLTQLEREDPNLLKDDTFVDI